MLIINKTEQVTDEQVDAALMEHIKDSMQHELKTEEAREIVARAEARALKEHKTVPGLGKCVAVMPAREFFRLQATYGADVVHSKEFIQFFNKKMPELSPYKA